MTHSNETTDGRPKASPFGLSISQIVGGALAAMAAAFLGSTLGISGTVLGAALASVSAAVLGTVITHSIRRAHERGRSAIGWAGQKVPPRTQTAVEIETDRARVRTSPRPGRVVYLAVVLGVVGLMLSFGGVLGLHLAENLSPYLTVVDLNQYAHRLLKIVRSGR